MNIVGVFLWIAVGATALHYWHGYLSEHKYTYVNSERQVKGALYNFLSIFITWKCFKGWSGIGLFVRTKWGRIPGGQRYFSYIPDKSQDAVTEPRF